MLMTMSFNIAEKIIKKIDRNRNNKKMKYYHKNKCSNKVKLINK